MAIPFASCSSSEEAPKGRGDVVLSLGDFTLTESEYMYILANVKNNVIYDYQYNLYQYTGMLYNEADILKMSAGENMTVGDYIKEYTLELAQQLLIMEKLCSDADIKITDQKDIDQINGYISDVEYAYGGTDLFEVALARLGFSRSGIKRFQEFSVRYELLKEYRYGESGIAQVSSENVYDYFGKNYLKYDGALYSYKNLKDSTKQLFEFTDDEVLEYFNGNYVKVRHVLYLTKDLNDQKKAEKKAKAEAAYDSVINGGKTLNDIKAETEDNGYEYTFTKGEMTENFEKAAFEMKVGEIRLVETNFGYHIMEKLETTNEDCFGVVSEDKTVKGGVKSAIISKLTAEKVRKEALGVLEQLKSGELKSLPAVSDEVKNYTVINSQYVDKTESDKSNLVKIFEDKEKDGYFEYEISGEGTYIFRNCSFESNEISAELFKTIKDKLSIEAFATYTKSFYDSVNINNEVLDRFDVATIPLLEEEFYTE